MAATGLEWGECTSLNLCKKVFPLLSKLAALAVLSHCNPNHLIVPPSLLIILPDNRFKGEGLEIFFKKGRGP